ncbi:hypothetical protein [Beijerinckia indica]|uniref:hypothetical protein n=1 Tax=Beijerinckia indica TaxID=533 RepID=UPI0011D0C28A|nr:hypothetical protein [Beijerinckia indica]
MGISFLLSRRPLSATTSWRTAAKAALAPGSRGPSAAACATHLLRPAPACGFLLSSFLDFGQKKPAWMAGSSALAEDWILFEVDQYADKGGKNPDRGKDDSGEPAGLFPNGFFERRIRFLDGSGKVLVHAILDKLDCPCSIIYQWPGRGPWPGSRKIPLPSAFW